MALCTFNSITDEFFKTSFIVIKGTVELDGKHLKISDQAHRMCTAVKICPYGWLKIVNHLAHEWQFFMIGIVLPLDLLKKIIN